LRSAQPTSPPAASRPAVATVRAPAKSRLRLARLLTDKPVIWALARRDLKARYKQSALGPAWVVFQPLALLVAFTIGFHSVAHVRTEGVPYALFALTGLVVWTYFQAVTMSAVGSLVNNYPLVRWTACPRMALPLATLVSNLPSFAVPAAAALIAAGADGFAGVQTLLVPFLFAWLVVLVAAVAIVMSAISVRARDVLSVTPFLLQVMLFLAPVAYGTSQLSPALRAVISLNPLTGLIEAWRWSLLGITPSTTAVVISLALTTVAIVVAWRLFTSLEVTMADDI
jgi:lipopolysaccharide transport system permease protein